MIESKIKTENFQIDADISIFGDEDTLHKKSEKRKLSTIIAVSFISITILMGNCKFGIVEKMTKIQIISVLDILMWLNIARKLDAMTLELNQSGINEINPNYSKTSEKKFILSFRKLL